MPPAKLGLVYGHTGLERFIDAVGIPRTKELFLTGRVFDGAARRGDRPRPRGPPRRRDRGPSRWSWPRMIAANAPISMTGQQARDRDPRPLPPAQPQAGGGAGRAAPRLLRLRGLPRGRARVRREAQAATGRAAERRGRTAESSPRSDPRIGGADRADRRRRDRDAAARPRRRPLPGAGADHRRPAGLDRRRADDLGPRRARPSTAAPTPERRSPPTDAEETLRAAGLSGRKASYMVGIAEAIVAGELRPTSSTSSTTRR